MQGVWKNYVEKTPQRVKLLDTFLGFLVAVGVLQFVYCVLVGNFVRFFFLFEKKNLQPIGSDPMAILEGKGVNAGFGET